MAENDNIDEKGRSRKRKSSDEVGNVPNKRLKSGSSAEEEPSRKLLNKIAEHVVCSSNSLQAIATDLGIQEGHFSRIQADNPKDSKAQAQKVVLFPLSVKRLQGKGRAEGKSERLQPCVLEGKFEILKVAIAILNGSLGNLF